MKVVLRKWIFHTLYAYRASIWPVWAKPSTGLIALALNPSLFNEINEIYKMVTRRTALNHKMSLASADSD
jgi:hypothetical protein